MAGGSVAGWSDTPSIALGDEYDNQPPCSSIPAPFYANGGYQVQGYEGYQVLRNPTYSVANAHTTGPTGPSNQKYASYNGPMVPAGYEGYQIEDFTRSSRTSQGVDL